MLARRILLGLVVVLGAVGGAGFWYVRAHAAQLELGVGYGARVACACRYIGHRELKSCYKDFEPGMEPIRLTDDPATQTVTASVPLIASRSVRFDPLLGCQPEPFKGTPYKVH
jgi:hypothetical protein